MRGIVQLVYSEEEKGSVWKCPYNGPGKVRDGPDEYRIRPIRL